MKELKEIKRISQKYHKKQYIYSGVLYIISQIITSLISLSIPTLLLYISIYQSINQDTLMKIFILFIVFAVFKILKTYSSKTLFYDLLNLRLSFIKEEGIHCMNIPYSYLENPEILDTIQQSQTSIGSPQIGIQSYIQNSMNLIYISFLLVLLSLVCIYISWILFFILTIINLFSYYTLIKSKDIEEKRVQDESIYNHKKSYLYREVMSNQDYAKEIRIFKMQDMLLDEYEDVYQSMIDIENQALHKNIKWLNIRSINSFLLQFFFYSLLMFLVMDNKMSIIEYSFYISILGSTFTYMKSFLETIEQIKKDKSIMKYYHEVMSYEEEKDLSSVTMDEPFESLEFRNVCFSYDKDHQVLNNISFQMQIGEKLALVGINGSGKSTIIKLICRFYKPTSGTILLNGVDIQSINIHQYRHYISAVFQDIHMYPFTILENVSMNSHGDIDKFYQSVSDMEMDDMIQSLPFQEQTLVGKDLYDQGIDLSGGQKQKLCVSRALYQDAPLLILDEPTSASDPRFELKFFQYFKNHFHDKACLLISHRLAATTFCDHILLLENGQIVEEGSYDELMAMNGNYAKLYQAQASMYLEDSYEEDV